MTASREGVIHLPLDKAVEYMLEECRMVLPGIQALFGFQLIAIFSERFNQAMDSSGKCLHLIAIFMIVIAIVLVMTPAALHRLSEPQALTERYLMTCSKLILAAMVPLALAILFETYLVTNVLLKRSALSLMAAIGLAAMFLTFWWAIPYRRRRRFR
ncbi:DUF6328 family protein [Solilutibacter silvestris]|uniref:Uncharacterized protein n=1 Tax=Solilutibacter silvestris TaxID=1645665 RepID=A0A2K1Q386_9GAMM|nr:DUF6328 family protein [Lysobacter silvestris]PNS09505.1 hypothetical protein Lysil_1134 [Lysobacter silvestris]